MKKIYSTLALAACVCLSASAVKPANVVSTFNGQATIQEVADFSNFGGAAKVKKNAPAKTAELNDFLGYFATEYIWALSGDDGAAGRTTAMIKDAGDGQVAIQIYPYCGGYNNVDIVPLLGNVDLAKGTVTIVTAKNQNLGTFTPSNGSPMSVTWFAADIVENPNYDPNDENSKQYMMQAKDEVVGTLQADGSIVFGGEREFLAFQVETGGYLGGFEDFKLVAPNYFKYNASEWENVGTASYEEYVINPLMQTPVPAIDVVLERNKARNYEYLLKDPYTTSPWDQVNDLPTATGFIQFTVYDPECIAVRPLTESGFYMNMADEGEPEDLVAMYMFNLEGYYLFTDDTLYPEDIIDIFPAEGYDLSTYDEDTRMVNVMNVYFGMSTDPMGLYRWRDNSGNSVPLWMNIEMPEGLQVVGVNEITNDSENAPKRFFNLQGMELQNPAAGQVVIVKQGNSSKKVLF